MTGGSFEKISVKIASKSHTVDFWHETVSDLEHIVGPFRVGYLGNRISIRENRLTSHMDGQ